MAVSVPVSVAVATLRVGVRAYINTGTGTVQVQTACVAPGLAVGTPTFTNQANTIALSTSAGDGMAIGYANNTVSCAAGNMLMVRANWTALSTTNYPTEMQLSW